MYMNVQGMGRNVFTCLITIFLLASCQSYKKVPYLQDVEVVEQTAQQENLYDAKIMPKDLLTIVVSCTINYRKVETLYQGDSDSNCPHG